MVEFRCEMHMRMARGCPPSGGCSDVPGRAGADARAHPPKQMHQGNIAASAADHGNEVRAAPVPASPAREQHPHVALPQRCPRSRRLGVVNCVATRRAAPPGTAPSLAHRPQRRVCWTVRMLPSSVVAVPTGSGAVWAEPPMLLCPVGFADGRVHQVLANTKA